MPNFTTSFRKWLINLLPFYIMFSYNLWAGMFVYVVLDWLNEIYTKKYSRKNIS